MPPSVTPPPLGPSRDRSPGDLLDVEELSRTRMLASMGLFLSGATLLLLPFLGGDPDARVFLAACLVLALVGSGLLLWSATRDERYNVWRVLIAGILWLLAALAGLRTFGIFSPVALLLPLGVLFFGMTRDPRAQALGYSSAAVSYLVVAVSVLHTGADVHGHGAAQAVSMVVLVELVLVVTFFAVRAARATTMLALARHERSAWAIVQKEAIVAELQKDLARALDVAGVGRYSETVVGSYKLGVVLGRGAMGEVYEAIHQTTHAPAAVKLLHTHTLREAGSVQRFQREATMAAALATPHAVRILEVGGFDGDLPYLAMERLRGEDLAEHLRKNPTLQLTDVAKLLGDVGAGLAAARKAGIVHRDVKPRNLFLADHEGAKIWKLLDFGVSKLATADVTHADGRIIGTPEYMAPEQAAGAPVTDRTDLFSLGAVVYRAVTGTQAFAGDHIAEVLYQVMHAMPPRPSALADVTPEVDLVMAIALAKTPDDRFATAEDLRDALLAASKGEISPELKERGAKLLAALPWGEPMAFDD